MTDKTDALIEQVEQMVGMGHAAWDTISPREIAAAFCKALAAPAASVDVPALWGLVAKWREEGTIDFRDRDSETRNERARARLICADELESILASGEAGSG